VVAALAAAVLAWGGWALWRRPERLEGHAYAVPSMNDRVTVEVLNASGRPGLARTATRVLRRQGLDVVFLGNASAVDSTDVVVRTGKTGAGERVRAALGQGRLRTTADPTRHVDVSVILGPDFREPEEVHP
jgi:hypothetical protein